MALIRVMFLCTQLLPVLVIALVLALHIFVRPYEKLRHNIIEAVVLVNYIFLFLLRGTQTFLDDLSTYTGNQVTAPHCVLGVCAHVQRELERVRERWMDGRREIERLLTCCINYYSLLFTIRYLRIVASFLLLLMMSLGSSFRSSMVHWLWEFCLQQL